MRLRVRCNTCCNGVDEKPSNNALSRGSAVPGVLLIRRRVAVVSLLWLAPCERQASIRAFPVGCAARTGFKILSIYRQPVFGVLCSLSGLIPAPVQISVDGAAGRPIMRPLPVRTSLKTACKSSSYLISKWFAAGWRGGGLARLAVRRNEVKAVAG